MAASMILAAHSSEPAIEGQPQPIKRTGDGEDINLARLS